MSLQTKIHYLKGYSSFDHVEGVIELNVSIPYTLKELYQIRFQGNSLPLSMTLLLDTSGSMKPSEDMLKVSTSTLIKLIPLGTTSLRIITFDTTAKEVKEMTVLSSTAVQDEVLKIANSLKVSNGSTNMNAALQLLQSSSSMQNIVMLSDGYANYGTATSSKDLLSTVKSVLKTNTLPTVFTTIGFNEPANLQMDILKDIASLTDGNLHIVQTPEKVQESFGDVICDSFTILAANVKFETTNCSLCSNISGQDKLNGLHLRYDAKRLIPFTLNEWNNPTIKVTYKDILENKDVEKVIALPLPPTIQDIHYEVDEACILSLASYAVTNILSAKEQFLLAREKLGPPPRAPFLSPYPGIGSLPYKRQALFSGTEDTINQSYQKMKEVYDESCTQLEENILTPAKNKLKTIIDRIDQNERKDLSILSSLRKELMTLYQMEIDNSTLNERIQNLSYDLIMQRSGVRDLCAPIGTLSINSTPIQNVVRMISNSLSQQPDIDAESATNMLEEFLEKKNI